jgi:hypothetical protein
MARRRIAYDYITFWHSDKGAFAGGGNPFLIHLYQDPGSKTQVAAKAPAFDN